MKTNVRTYAVPLPGFAMTGRALMALLLAGVYWTDVQQYFGSSSPPRLILAISALLVPVSAYFYVLVRRFWGVVLAKRSRRAQESAALITATAALVPSMQIFGTPVLLVLHVVVLGLLMELLYGLSVRPGRVRARWWRTLYLSGVVPLAGVLLLGGYGAVNIRRPVLTEYTVTTEKPLPPGGYTIALITDLHYGNALTAEDLAADVRTVAEARPDLVLLGGDIVDEHTGRKDMREAFELLSQIPAGDGTYYVYGNHDKALYTSEPAFTPGELAEAIEGAGISILEDRSAVLPSGLTLTGRQDRSDPMRTGVPRADAASLMEGLDPQAYHILLDHQPREFEANAAAGYDLMLSGHTHSGQIWPMGLLVEALDRGTILYGHEARGGMDVIVSSGLVGWGYPIRTEGHSEAVIVRVVNSRGETDRV